MPKTDALFMLIKSMTQGEKRHFKLATFKYAREQKKDYLRLFAVLDSQKIYDESAFRKKIKREPWSGQLKFVKLYLHQQILKSLKTFHDNSSYSIKLHNQLIEIELLYKKELLKIA